MNQPQQPQQQMCSLPGGGSAPCSAIANPGGAQPQAGGAAQQGAPPPLGTKNDTPFAPGTCTPTFYCSDNNLYYRTSTCVDQVNQVCPDGCEGERCKGSRGNVSDLLGSALSDIATKDATSTDKKATSSLSAFDQLNLIIDPNAVGSTPTTAPLVLTSDVNDASRLQGSPPPPGTTPLVNPYGLTPPGAQQTFTSGDLMESGYFNPQELTGFQSALTTLRERLERIVAYLRPFGRPLPEGEHAHFE